MDEKTDAQLGTAIKLLYHRGEHKAVNLLLSAKDILWEFDTEDWSINYYELGIVVDIEMFDEYNDDKLFDKIVDAFRDVMRADRQGVTSVRLYPAQVQVDWRKDIEAHLRGKPKNQASLVALPDRFPVRDAMRFRDKAELSLYEALKEKQHSQPVTDTITLAPNPSVRVLGHTWEPDFLVVYHGRTGVIEVDGGSHRKKYASDKSRDRILEDCGISCVERIDVADAEDPELCKVFVDAF
jgi:hypothetical protein